MTVKLEDQLEIYPKSYFSASYLDYHFHPDASIFQRNRKAIYSKINPYPHRFGNLTVNRNVIIRSLNRVTTSLANYYKNYLAPVTNLTSPFGPSSYYINKFSESDFVFADSVLPRPVDIYVINGGVLVEGGEFEDATYPISRPKAKMIFGTIINNCTITSSTDSGPVSDNTWGFSFPFENQYSTLERLLNPAFDKSLNVPITESYYQSPYYTEWTNQATSRTASEYTVSFVEKAIGSIAERQAITFQDQVVTFNNGSIVTLRTEYPSIADTNSAFYGFYSLGNGKPVSWKYNSRSTLYYNPGKFPQPIFNAIINTVTSGSEILTARNFYGFNLNGWKYGIYNANPVKNTCHFRSGHFGQFRDMLEQRLDTKFFSLKDGKSQPSPVQITFASDSSSFVTSSNPLTLNPTVSGIYDKEAKSGKPFDDSWNGTI